MYQASCDNVFSVDNTQVSSVIDFEEDKLCDNI